MRGLPLTLMVHSDLTVVEKAEIEGVGDIGPPPAERRAGRRRRHRAAGRDVPRDRKSVAAVIKLRGYDDTYLYVARPLDPRVIEQLQATQESVAEFANLETRRVGVQIAFALMYTVIALIVLLSAVWIGLNFANRLVAPIRRLIGAANLVSTGNLYVQVPVRRGEGDLSQLGETFNKMTQELRTQRDDLMRARDLIDSRRRFTEAVLAGASAGVIGVDSEGKISILNRSAEKLIGQSEADAAGRNLTEVMPELEPLFTEARTGMHRLVQGQITISRDMRERNLSVRVTTEQSADEHHGYVVTLDDITDLVDRAAHLGLGRHRAAHRARDQEPAHPDPAFGRAAEAQIRQGHHRGQGGVRAMHRHDRAPGRRHQAHGGRVLALRAHAEAGDDLRGCRRHGAAGRVPAARRQSGHRHRVRDRAREDAGEVRPPADLAGADQHRQERHRGDRRGAAGRARASGRIRVSVKREGSDIVIDVIDNGTGLPKENRNRLLEPYVTTREKGTGLGLAIVGRILEEHGGRMELFDAPEVASGGRGAWVRLRFAAESVGGSSTEPQKSAKILEAASE